MPPLVKLLYDNLGIGATWSTASQVSTLPVSNLGDARRGLVTRTTGLTGQFFTADLGSAKTVEAVAIVSGNLTASATVTIKANASDAGWGTPAFSVGLTPWVATRSGVILKILASAQTFRYWRIEVEDATNPDGYIQIGVIVLSPLVALTVGPMGFRYRRVDPSLTGRSPGGTPYETRFPKHAEIELDNPFLTEALVFGTLQTALETMGQSRDVVLSLFPDAPSADDIAKATNLYSRLGGLAAFQNIVRDQYGWTLDFVESL